MGRGPKASKLMETKNQYLSDLPDDILSTITCMLDLKDAVRTSILSKRWRYNWINHPHLIFDHFNVLGLSYEQLKENFGGADTVFVNYVSQIMQQRLKGEGNIKTFRVTFELGKYFSKSIDSWISCAVRKGVETIDLQLLEFPFNSRENSSSMLNQFHKYNFSLLRTVSENKGSLKHLRVAFCNFRGRSSSKKCGSLVSLQLQSVNISDFQLSKVLESCPLLEKLCLHSCSTLGSLSIGQSNNNPLLKILSLKNCLKLVEIDIIRAPSLVSLEFESVNITNAELIKVLKSCPILEELTLHTCPQLTHLIINDSNNSAPLKILSLNNCFKLREIDLCFNNLHTFSYIGLSGGLSFKIKTPKLVNALISESKFSGFHITKLCFDIPTLENFILSPELSFKFFKYLDYPMPAFFNTRRLFLHVYPSNNDDQSSIISYILKCFPLLQTLELNLRNSVYKIEQKESPDKDVLKNCTNGSITKLVLNGFMGLDHEVDMLKYLLENLTGLKVLAIGPSYKGHTSFNNLIHVEGSVWGKRWFKHQSKQLREIVPSFVRLELL